MPTRIRTRTNSRRARDPVRIINHDASKPYIFSPARVQGYDETMQERELQRYAAHRFCKTLKRSPKGVRVSEKFKRQAVTKFKARLVDKNRRYPLSEIIAAKKAGRRMKPQTQAAYW